MRGVCTLSLVNSTYVDFVGGLLGGPYNPSQQVVSDIIKFSTFGVVLVGGVVVDVVNVNNRFIVL